MNIKKINLILLIIVIILICESYLNIFGRIALINNNFGKARLYLSIVRNKTLLGLIYYKQNKFEKAFYYFKKRNDFKGMGWAYYGMGKYDQALDYFKKVDDNVGIGQIKLAQGSYKEAQNIFKETSEYSGLGLTDLINENYDNSIESFKKAKDKFGLGLAYFAKGDIKTAINIFKKSNNQTAYAIIHIVNQEFNKAIKVLKNINNNSILPKLYKYMGIKNKALDLYLETNQVTKAANLYIEFGEFIEAHKILTKKDDKIGLANLYEIIGDDERALFLYKKSGKYGKVIELYLKRGDITKAINYGKRVLKKFPYNNKILLLVSDIFRLNHEYNKSLAVINRIDKTSSLALKIMLLKCRLNFMKDKGNLNVDIFNTIIKQSGVSYISKDIINVANIYNLNVNKPITKEEKMIDEKKKLSMKFIIYPIIVLILIIIGFVIFKIREFKKQEARDLDGLRIDITTGRKTHSSFLSKSKDIKDISHPVTDPGFLDEDEEFNVEEIIKNDSSELSNVDATTDKVNQEKISETKGDKEESKVQDKVDDKQESIQNTGVQILQIALKKLNIISSSLELINLSGEGGGKLTVYGIYLAARGKGAQVQGIKVDKEFLLEDKNSVKLIFFLDESFALLEEISENKAILLFGLDNVKEFSMKEFEEKWNGYVILLNKGN